MTHLCLTRNNNLLREKNRHNRKIIFLSQEEGSKILAQRIHLNHVRTVKYFRIIKYA